MFAVLALVLAQNLVPAGIDGPIYASGRPLAFFEFAPASGAGLGAPCACAAVTGAKGEAVTWTRGSSAMCTKSASETSIANGDLVLCGNNQPRVMFLGGPLGVLVESSRINSTIRSQEFNDAAYIDSFGVVAAPTFNGADLAVAPDGTMTADAYTFPATTGGAQYSARVQAGGCPATNATGTVYVKGQSGSGSMDVCAGTTGCFTCNYTTTAWTRCGGFSATAANLYVGNMSAFNGSIARGVNAVYLWGAQCEATTAASPQASSYIPTTTIAVTRAADPQPNVAMAGAVGPTMCLAATVTPTGATPSVIASLGTVAPNFASVGWASDTTASFVINATTTTPAVASLGTLTPHRFWLSDAAGTRVAKVDNVTVAAPAASMGAGKTYLVLGSSTLVGIVSRVQADKSPGACAP